MYYPEELIEEVRSKNDIVDVIGSYVRLQKKGTHYFGLCPFHNEKTPSFSVTGGNRQMFYCYGCHASGSVITFVMKYENLTFPEAVKVLADRAGVELPEAEYSEASRERERIRDTLLEINKEAATYFYVKLRDPSGEIGQAYFDKRQLTEETRKHFGLGYSGKAGDGLLQYLKSKGYSDEMIIRAGLAQFHERSGLTPFFWNRVMFPIQDMNHRVIGFGGRVMGDGEPKYLNSRETEIFDKRKNLFGLNFARTSRQNYLILCEGYMDVISMHQAGFTQAVASLGTAFTTEQASLIRNRCRVRDVYLSYDSDGAGTNAALRAIEICNAYDIRAKVIRLEPYKDPDEFIKNLGREEFQKRIDQAESSFFFELRILERGFDMTDPESKTEFYKEVAARICKFPDELERDNYVQAAAAHYGIAPEKLNQLVVKHAIRTGGAEVVERPKSGRKPKADAHDNNLRKQRILLTWLSEQPDLYMRVREYLSPKDFTEELYRSIAEKLFQQLENGSCNPAAMINMFDEEEDQQTVGEIFNTRIEDLTDVEDRTKAFNDVLRAVKEEAYEAAKDGLPIMEVLKEKKRLEELKKITIPV